METTLEWNLYYGDFNSGKIEVRNVFNHGSFLMDLGKDARKYKDDKEKFLERLRSHLMYYYWSKCEWEVVISHWPPSDNERYKAIKIDVFDQVMMNWPHFSEYVWEHRRELSKIKDDRKRFSHSKNERKAGETDDCGNTDVEGS